MLKNKNLKIVVTGAESTGKSTLTNALAKHYNCVAVPELARGYVENLNRHYTYFDVEEIARLQIKQFEALQNEKFVFFDTWLIITKVWFDFVYGKHPSWLHNSIIQSQIDLFLICDTDVPWEPDMVRENGGTNREILQQTYISELQNYGFTYQIVSGIGEQRIINAIKCVDNFCDKKA